MRFECQHLCKSYRSRNGDVTALDGVSFDVTEQEFVSIVGPSGCGKTTLLKIIAGLLEPTAGRIVFHDEVDRGRPRSALVFQEHGLFPWMTVLDNVAFGLKMQGKGRQVRLEQAQAFIAKVGLAHFGHNYPHELSIGMRQRVGIARAFVTDPEMLLMDEPLGSLDAQTKIVLQEELLRIWKDYQKQVVYITHDIEEALLLSDRVLVMTGRPGRIREEIQVPLGRPRNLSAKERSEITEIKWHVWRMLKEEVRDSLWVVA